MKKTTLFLIAGTFLFVGYKNLPDTMSNGAPTASTGAPDERNCTSSGCHSDYKMNSGNAELSVSIANGITHYVPGKTYPITVSISNPGLVRFGFQVVALKNSDNTNAGFMKIVDYPRTQIIPGYGTMSDRKYVTYTYEGTNAVSTGLGKWQFEWTAPTTNEGAITFYVASIAANNDGTDYGDHCYSKQITLDAEPIFWNVYPTVSSSNFNIQNSGLPIQDLKIYNSSGSVVYKNTNLEPGTLNMQLTEPSGIYFLSTTQNGKTEVQKIVISR